MNIWRKFETLVKPWMLVVIFIIVLLFGFWQEGRADQVNAEIGPTFLSGEFSKAAALIVNQTWDNKWRVGMGYVSSQEVTPRKEPLTEIRANLFVHGQRVVKITENFDLGLGIGYFNATTRWNGSHFVASMSLEYSLTDRWDIRFRHFSNAGSASPNMGQDMLTIGYRF